MNKNYFEMGTDEHNDIPFGANLRLRSYDMKKGIVTVSHYGDKKTFTLPMSMGCIRMNVPRNKLFLSFGIFFPIDEDDD